MARQARKDTGETVRALLSGAQAPPRREASEPDIEPIEPPERPKPAPRRAAARPEPAGTTPITQTRIPASLFALVREAKAATGDTHETWFLDAYDAVDDQLPDVYQPAAARRTKMPVRRRRTRRPSTDPLASYPLRLTPEEVAVLEERAAELQPPSLADFVTTIVRLRLQQLGYDVEPPPR